MPSAIVSVANTTRQSPRSNNTSIKRFTAGSTPAWWTPAPRWSARKIDWFSVDSPIDGESASASAIARSISRCWSRVTKGRPSVRTSFMARSQPARLKMK